ncbi:MAG TPA: DUF4384 domain-containing protein [Thermoanaerobaculia bacterium]|nr:DUF4384 domain-containing protein [Thermoanaerobaculia bacterium]
MGQESMRPAALAHGVEVRPATRRLGEGNRARSIPRWRAAIAAACTGVLLASAAGGQSAAARRPGQLFPTARPGTLIVRVGLEKVAGSAATAVPLDHVFQSGDRLRISISVNRAGYLRLLARGADGKTERLWPPGSEATPIGADESVLVPGDGSIRLDEKPGTERVEVIFSSTPIAKAPVVPVPGPAGRDEAPGTIRQIRLRNLIVDRQAAEGDLGSYFTGDLGKGGVATVAFEIRHQARR